MKNVTERFNYGIALLKMLMCFEVVLIHFWTKPTNILLPLILFRDLAVPVFMFLSFYLTEKTFLTTDKIKTKKRIWRVVFPQIGWSIIYWFILSVLQIEIDYGITINDLFWQILTGHSPHINPTMWFQTVLIVLTLVFVLSFTFLRKKAGLFLVSTITLLSLWVQYSGLNIMLFGSLRYELRYPLGRLFEMIPYASLGFYVAYFDLYSRLNRNRTLLIIIFGLVILLLFRFDHIIPSSSGFGYTHNNNFLHVFFIVGFAYLLPFGWMPDKAKQTIHFITKYTLGIYCMHRIIGLVLNILFSILKFEVNSFILCIIIYIVSFYVSFIICRVSPNYLKQLVE